MSDLGLSIAGSGINADQTALDTISQNLANANTAGYVSETANLTTMPDGDILGIGGGVNVYSVTQVQDSLLQTNANQTQATLSNFSALQQVLTQAQLAFPVSTTSGLANDLSNFWNSWDTIASDPSSGAGYQEVVNYAQTLSTDLTQANAQLTQAAQNASSQLDGTVNTANTLLSELATVNSEILKSKGQGGADNALVDQQNSIMTQLSSAVGATSTVQPNGTLQVNIGGYTVLQGTSVSQLQVATPTGATGGNWGIYVPSVTATPTQASLVSVTSGTAAGLLSALNSYLPAYQTQLNTVASNLAGVVNDTLGAGYNNTAVGGVAVGTLGGIGALFTTSGSTTATAATMLAGASGFTIGVSQAAIANPTGLAVAANNNIGANGTLNDGTNAQNIADYGTEQVPTWSGTNTPVTGQAAPIDTLYQSLVEQVGTDVSSTNSQVTAQTSAANAAQENLQSVAGVNQNDQLVALMNFQNAYQASAKVLNTMDDAIQSLLQAV